MNGGILFGYIWTITFGNLVYKTNFYTLTDANSLRLVHPAILPGLRKAGFQIKVPDEPVLFSNKKGTLSFARSGVQTRGNALYINLRDNPRLDTLHVNNVTGYPAFGEVKTGMEVVHSLYTGYAESTMRELRTLRNNRTVFLQTFPLLDSITKAYVLKK